ncbi:Gfo/Idh/MocA family protein [Anaeromicropila herbilytica]|uniref:NAD(P)-dependent oxidoreductase n=1 Tax=Anaeromicropila herbilytica TaxID=2785025 RepID=A0A7R7EJD5_9FIRM|nr:Gfo/Idh/MocA family oxidoreductase [Anaeromicropila herbilytica]BCN29850.1 NAD(P)-dependent oxidoreductase [Anaeromicropila herbilytica]
MKLGIVGLGGIVPQCLESIKEIEYIECVAICVREPKVQLAKEVATKYQFNKVYTVYDEMLMDDEIDFVYIGIINSLHYQYAKKALEYGKHVITEKPFTSTVEEAEEIINLAIRNKLFLFEAITVLYSPNYIALKKYIPQIGDIKLIQGNFSQYSSRYGKYLNGEVLPAFDPKLSGGALYDINIYNIHFVVGLFGEAKDVLYNANLGYNGVDTSGIVTLKYDNFIVTLIGAKDSSSPCHIIIQGTKGYIRMNGSPNICESIDIVIEDKIETLKNNSHKNHMVNEFIAFEEMYRLNQLDQCYDYLAHSLKVMKTAVRARKDANIIFDADCI